jgi:hypothetical protein
MIEPVMLAAMSSAAAALMKTLLRTREQEKIGDAATDIVRNDPASPQRVRDLFESTKKRLGTAWIIGIVMTVTLFGLFLGMVLTAVVLGVVFDKPMYSAVFGGLSAASLLTVVIWKPYEMTFGATITIQRLEMILITLEQEWQSCQEIQDPQLRSKRIAEANKAALNEIAKLTTKRA